MSGLQKNVASQNITFGLVSATTGAALSGATVTVYVVKDGGAQATSGGTTTSLGNGQYNFAPTQSDTNATDVGFAFTATGAIPVYYDFHTDVVDANGYPSINLVDIAGTASAGTAGYVGIDWGHVNAPTTTVGLTGTTISTTQQVASVSGAVGSVTGSVGGSVASVTGAVGSVTGNVGGNVVGSVASVTGAVGSVTGNVGGNVVGSVASVTAAVAITSNVKINQSLSGFTFLMTDSTTHAPKTGLTVASVVSHNGGAFASTTNSATEIANGWYTINLSASDMNANVVSLRFTAAASDDRDIQIVTQP